MDTRPRVAVVGGGISGLAAAYFLRTLPGPRRPDVTLIEADSRLGGKIRTSQVAGLPVDTGPDAFLSRAPRLKAVLEELGLTGAVTGPAASGAYVWSRGRLRPLPPGTFGVPERLVPLLRSGLLSPRGVLRAGLDLVLPQNRLPTDPSVGQMLRPRFGTEVFDRLVEPLLGGVHAGRADLLSARSTVPELEALARRSRSLYLGLRHQRAARERQQAAARAAGPARADTPALVSLSGGLGRLVDALAAQLPAAQLRLGQPVVTLDRAVAGYRLRLADGSAIDADAVILATPAFVTADLIGHLVPQTAAILRGVPYVGVASVTVGYRPGVVGRPMDATGFLVPPGEDRLLVGCTWLSAKWPHLSGAPTTLFRCLVGRHGDTRFVELDDAALVRAVHDEISGVLGLTGVPEHAHVQRFPRAMPQYTVGHAARLADIEAGVAELPGLYLTGAAYRGVGLAGCVAQAAQAAENLLGRLGLPAGPTPGGSPAGGRRVEDLATEQREQEAAAR